MSTPAPAKGVASKDAANVDDRTIADFGDQWTAYQDNSEYYGSVAMLADIFGPSLTLTEVAGMRVGDIGSGSGRIERVRQAVASQASPCDPRPVQPRLRQVLQRTRGKVIAGRQTNVRLHHRHGYSWTVVGEVPA